MTHYSQVYALPLDQAEVYRAHRMVLYYKLLRSVYVCYAKSWLEYPIDKLILSGTKHLETERPA